MQSIRPVTLPLVATLLLADMVPAAQTATPPFELRGISIGAIPPS